jgi:Bacterial archaeo-eukaryotic release factor family 3
METDALTAEVLHDVRAPQSYPAVSLTMPTHRRQPDNAQDPVRLRNLLAEAVQRIEADPRVGREDRIAVCGHLEQAAAEAEVELRHALDGLIVYATAREHQIWMVPRTVPSRVVLSDTFLTRNLVAAKAQARPFWVLAVAADRATLWSGSGETLHAHERDGFPATPEPVEWDVQHQERTGGRPSTLRDEETLRFLRTVDASLAAVLAADPRPLLLVGLAPVRALLQELGTAAREPAATVDKGGLVDGPAPVLLKETAEARAGLANSTADLARRKLDEARSHKAFAAGLDEVWEATRSARSALIAIEDHYQLTVRVADGHIEPADDQDLTQPEVHEDIVDELAETALDTGAEVVFVPDGTLSDQGRIAAVLRY